MPEGSLYPTLIIGLGGSGAEVIMRLRRLLVDRYGSLDNLPIVRFLYLDTDPNWLMMQSGKDRDIGLSSMESMDLAVDLTPIIDGIVSGELPHLSWLSSEKFRSLTRIRIHYFSRQLGRLCFWHHYGIIRHKITTILGELLDPAIARLMEEKHGIKVEPSINIQVVTSLVGQTGSGMVWDLAYLAQRVAQDISADKKVIDLLGYLILPGAFRDISGAVLQANGYAALKELNYYSYNYRPDNELAAMFGEPFWSSDYTGQERDRVAFKGRPPFDFCYLLDNCNPHVQLDRSDLFGMIARSIFLDLCASAAPFKHATRYCRRKVIWKNDALDSPKSFISLGLSAVLLPRKELGQILQHRLALKAVQEWIDPQAAPFAGFNVSADQADKAEFLEAKVASLKSQAEMPEMVDAARAYAIREIFPALGLIPLQSVVNSVLADHEQRLTDIPYGLRESEKERWVTEEWPYDEFPGRLSETWRRWRADFHDEEANPRQWGEKIRRMVANQKATEDDLRQKLSERIFSMLEDPERYGPAFALCFTGQIKVGLGKLKEQFLKEANDANHIATLLGEVRLLIDPWIKKGGLFVTSAIEARIRDCLEELKKAAEAFGFIPWRKRDRVNNCAYAYLTWCAHWCRARAEERARRLAADLAEGLCGSIIDLRRQLFDYASTLAGLQTELATRLEAWEQRAAGVENIGEVLFNPLLVQALEVKINQVRGDCCDPGKVAEKALVELGRPLRDLQPDVAPQLLKALLHAAGQAIGDLDEEMLTDTHFAAYDLLSAQVAEDDVLDQVLKRVSKISAPYISLNTHPPGGNWHPIGDLRRSVWAAMRGGGLGFGYDTDSARVRVKESLKRIGLNIETSLRTIEDSSQIVFFQECGGFPLRALRGIEEMKNAYEEHRREGNTPLHIVREEMAAHFPDILPPKKEHLELARLIKTVAIPLGFIKHTAFFHPHGGGRTITEFAFSHYIPTTKEWEPVSLGTTPEEVFINLVNDPALAEEINQTMAAAMNAASDDEKRAYVQKLKDHLDDFKSELRRQAGEGADPFTHPAFRMECGRVEEFLRTYGLIL